MNDRRIPSSPVAHCSRRVLCCPRRLAGPVARPVEHIKVGVICTDRCTGFPGQQTRHAPSWRSR